mmetsp:Transcript_19567/g.35885  ORF Transcript_19567/g.35885 Transcript_19567/m.35885 type:complete len:246 (-) Transcript_19567:76-813(-)
MIKDPSLFTFDSQQLLRDLKASPNCELKDWLFVGVLEEHREVSSGLIHQILQIGTPGLIQSLEADLVNRRYRLLADNLETVMSELHKYSTSEQAYLGRLISAEIPFSRAAELLNYIRCWNDSLEALRSELVFLPFFRLHSSEIGAELARMVLSLPFKHTIFVAAVFTQVAPTITAKTLEICLITRDFSAKKNTLNHMCTWMQVPVLSTVLKLEHVQDLLSRSLLQMSSEYFSAFNHLLVNKLYCL